ncbi:MAG TPA: hypothetical protein VGA87_05595, partial [Pyrinomonadaceae bacterium]
FIPSAFGEIINELFRTRIGHLISIGAIMNSLWRGLFGLFQRESGSMRGTQNGRIIDVTFYEPPLWSSWLMLAIFCGFFVLLLMRKVRAYEVVKRRRPRRRRQQQRRGRRRRRRRRRRPPSRKSG